MLRVGEITSRSPKSCDSNNILFQNIQFSPNAVTLNMHSYKHSNFQTVSIKIPEHKKNNLCPVKALKTYLALRGQHKGPLFTLPNGDAVSCQFFNQQLNTLIIHSNLPQGRYSSHSLRIGGATTAIIQGASEAQVKVMGRWKSEAFKKYIRLPIVCNPTNQ